VLSSPRPIYTAILALSMSGAAQSPALGCESYSLSRGMIEELVIGRHVVGFRADGPIQEGKRLSNWSDLSRHLAQEAQSQMQQFTSESEWEALARREFRVSYDMGVWSEFIRDDGNTQLTSSSGEVYLGFWRFEGDQLCFSYGTDNPFSCKEIFLVLGCGPYDGYYMVRQGVDNGPRVTSRLVDVSVER
jgi:hypothetical protein